jgi:hypothetical protein
MTEKEQCFIKLGKLGKKMQAIGDIISYFFPLCLYFFPIRPCNNCSTFIDGVIGGKYGKKEIKSYNV